jgi:methanogenic corrinoid protein MtbC1
LDVGGYLAALMINNPAPAVDLFQKDPTDGQTAQEIVNNGLISAMTLVGDKFQAGSGIYGPVWYIHAILTGAFMFMIQFKEKNKCGTLVIFTTNSKERFKQIRRLWFIMAAIAPFAAR